MSTWISKEAHKSYQLLYSFLHQRPIHLMLRLKIEAFIGKLSGPEISFYCYDLITMIMDQDQLRSVMVKSIRSNVTKRFDDMSSVLCADKLQISDDQLAELRTQCESNNATSRDEVLKTCLNTKELTDRQKMTSICGTQKTCIVDHWVKVYENAKPEDLKRFFDMCQKYICCIKKVLKVN
ncbi:unnamed protein product [Oppiella nova]|uniref:Uncharacterized protein n=1 Tax=Oppiella nova TaxID=334625 RepID=A0A7R9M416_9ACAR|nr:unnamed protein product [Oppiella nova]CAG2170367.1 unnamed protein product [Oppiella nova]